MTDKQIIIYKKECYNEPHCSLNQVLEQLKRSEAQCEAMFVSHTDLEKKYKAKEQECERLKHDNGYEVGALERTIDNLKAENKHLNDLLNQALKELEELQEGLENG